jgi:hypothetical protein
VAHRVSPRRGELWLEERGARVGISGRVVKYLEGRIFVSADGAKAWNSLGSLRVTEYVSRIRSI